MGSKYKICAEVCSLFPKADHFYDLFGGGFSISHYMLLHRSRDFKTFHYNEIRPGIGKLIQDAIAGKYSYQNFKPAWVSREEFFKLKDSDPYIKICWSFGNNGANYIFGKDIESYKKSMHMAVVFNEFDDTARKVFGMEKFKDGYTITDKRLLLRNRIIQLTSGKKVFKGNLEKGFQRLQHLEQLQRLERLEQLERLERLQQLQQLHFHEGSYSDVKIKENSVLYCDIPYQMTADYDGNSQFNRKQFLDWAASQKEPVFISEYQVNDSRFKCVSARLKRSMLKPDKSNTLIKTEKVFANEAAVKILFKAQ